MQNEKLVTVTHQGNAAKPSETTKAGKGIDRFLIISWLFLIGSLIFTLDSGFEFVEGISLHSICHLSASLAFTIGSALFIPNTQKQ